MTTRLQSRGLLIIMSMALALLLGLPLNAQEQLAIGNLQSSSSSSAQVGAAPTDNDGWHFSLSPYLWLAGTHGTVGALGHSTSARASIGDLLSHFDIGLMGAAEARHKRLLLNGDMIWIRLSDSSALPFPGLSATSADVRVGQFIWTSKFGYRAIDHEKMKADANVGVRYWHLGQKLSFNPSRLGIDFNGSQNWADILVGGRVLFPVGESTTITLAGDVGGWDASAKLDYQFATLLEHKLSAKWSLGVGYRYLFIDYRKSPGFVYNMVTPGVVLGATWKLK